MPAPAELNSSSSQQADAAHAPSPAALAAAEEMPNIDALSVKEKEMEQQKEKKGGEASGVQSGAVSEQSSASPSPSATSSSAAAAPSLALPSPTSGAATNEQGELLNGGYKRGGEANDPETGYYDECEIEDMEYDEETRMFTYPCPCGDKFRISRDDLLDGEDIARCPSCSLLLKVIYDPDDLEEEDD